MVARSAAFLAVFTLLGVYASGCIGAKDPVTAANFTNKTPTTNATCFDSCTKIVAFNETNKTETGAGGVDHTHDYWAGKSRMTIMTRPVAMRPAGATSSVAYKAVTDFHPPQGAFVYEGTASVEITLTSPTRHACVWEAGTLGGYPYCTDTINNLTPAPNVPPIADPTGGPSGLTLRYKHASASDWLDGGPIVFDKPLSIKVTDPKQNDMPHVTSSAWEFEILSPNEQDRTLSFTVKVDLVRGVGPIPLWPGHPNFYADNHARTVLDTEAVACDGSTSCALPDAKDAKPVKAQKLISYGTRTLYVWINISSVFDPNPALAVDNWFLWHWNTTGRDNITNPFDKTTHGATIMKHAWILPVDDNGMDSPYADGSKWTFQLGGALYKAGLSCYGGCADWYAKYHITVIATDKALDVKDYDWQCLRDDYCPKPNAAASANDAMPTMPDARAARPGITSGGMWIARTQ